MDKHVDQMVMQPTRHFDNPDEVLSHPGLKYQDRLRILESWKLDAQRLAESTAENMSGGEQGDLSGVSRALLQLKSIEMLPRATQHGGARRPEWPLAGCWVLAPVWWRRRRQPRCRSRLSCRRALSA